MVLKHNYHKQQFPQTRAKEEFQPYTATGKLKAVITPTIPSGFHCSINTCPRPKNSENNLDMIYWL